MFNDVRYKSYFSFSYNEPIPDNYVVLDLETTGLHPDSDKITEIAILKYEKGELVSTYSTLVNPKVSIPDIVVEKTNITNEMVEDMPYIEDIIKDIFDFIGDDIVVGHNIYYFDLPFLLNELKNSGKKVNTKLIKYIDTLFLAKKYIPSTTYRLENLKDMLNITIDSHRASSDCYVCNELLKKCFEKIK